jgi:hypothetical protein
MDFGGWFNRNLTQAEWEELFTNPYGWFKPAPIKRYNKLWIAQTFNNSLTLPATTGYSTLTGQKFTNTVTFTGTTVFIPNVGNWFNTLTLPTVSTFNGTYVAFTNVSLTLTGTTGFVIFQGVHDVTITYATHPSFNLQTQIAYENTLTFASFTSTILEDGNYLENLSLASTTAFNPESAFVQNVSISFDVSTAEGWVLEVIHVGVVDASNTLHFTQSAVRQKIAAVIQTLTLLESASVAKVLNQLATNQLVFAQLANRTLTFTRTVSQVFPIKQGSIKPLQILGAPVVQYVQPAAFVYVVPKKSFLLLQAPGWSIALPNPELGDSQEHLGKVAVKRSINNSVYSYIKRSDLQKLSYNFRMTRNKSLELQAFVDANIANPITMTTYQGEIWVGKISNNPLDFVPKDRWYPTRERVDVTIDFTGVRVF